MSEVSRLYATVAAGFSARVEGVAGDQWSDPSPCQGWTARDVVSHVVETHRRVIAVTEGRGAPIPTADEDVVASWHAVSAAVRAALADPAEASKTLGARFGNQTFEQLVGRILSTDTLVHTWDLARATGQDDRLDTDSVQAAFAHLAPIDEALRVPGGFGPKIDPPLDADQQTRFLCFVGRRV